MQTQFLYYLLGVCLLLIQLPDKVEGDDLDEPIKACGREYVRLHIEACGSTSFKGNRRDRSPRRNRRKTEKGTSSSTKKKAEGLHTAAESGFISPETLMSALSLNQRTWRAVQPALHKLNKNSSPPELNHLILDKHSREKRQVPVAMASKCCIQGCTRRELIRLC